MAGAIALDKEGAASAVPGSAVPGSAQPARQEPGIVSSIARWVVERAGGSAGHKGREAALTAIEMAHTMREIEHAYGAREK